MRVAAVPVQASGGRTKGRSTTRAGVMAGPGIPTRSGVKANTKPKADASPKAAYHHGDLRAALVEAAARLAEDLGPAAVTLREVARRAGVSQAAPYHHFADKSALIAAVAEEGFRLFDAHQAAALAAAPPDPAERLGELGVSYVRFALRYPHYFRVMFRPYLFDGLRTPSFKAVADPAFERLVETTRAARSAAGHQDEDASVPAMAMWAMPHGLASLALDSSSGSSLTLAVMEMLVRAAVAALVLMDLDELRQQAMTSTRPSSALRHC